MDFDQTENQFAILAESLPQLVWSARPDGFRDYFNRRWYEFTGIDPEESLGDGWQKAVHPYDLAQVRRQWRQSVETGTPYDQEYRIRNAQGNYEWVLSRASPIQDLTGMIVRWFGTSTNIDGQKRAEEALRILENQYRLALEAAHLGTWQIDLEKGEINWDEEACALYGILHHGRYSLPLERALMFIHPDDRETVTARVKAACDPGTDGRYEIEYRIILPSGQVRWLRSHGQALFAQEDEYPRATVLSGVVSDITERHAWDESQELLTRELNHRVKNLFAIVNGLVSMTARTARDPKDMATALRGRLNALSRAHEMAQPTSLSGSGVGASVELGCLVLAVIEPYRQSGHSRISAEGPEVRMGSNTATSLALVLHELATNAAKYGCLSRAEGTLDIHWTLKDNTVNLLWTESGGPPVETSPSFEGFGSQLSQRSISGQLGGTLEREWRREGLLVRMSLPLDRLTS